MRTHLKDIPIRRYAVGLFVLALLAAILGGKSLAQYFAYAAGALLIIGLALALWAIWGPRPVK